MTIVKFLADEVVFDKGSGIFFAKEADYLQQILDLRGWGRIQHLFKTEKEAMDFQDGLGDWIADAINQKLQKEKQDGK